MLGTYYRTLKRNEFDGYTEFLFSPQEYCEETVDGLIKCIGNIGVYSYKVPLNLTGEFKNHIFQVESASVAVGEEQTRKMLDYFFEGSRENLTESEKNRIVCLVGENILDYAKNHLDDGRLHAIVGDYHKLHVIAKGCEKLNTQRELTDICLQHGVTLGQVDFLLSHNVNIHTLKRNAYLPFLQAGIHIYKADSIMEKLNGSFHTYHPIRIYGYILEALKLSEQCGNVCITPQTLCTMVNRRMSQAGLGGEISTAMLNYIFWKKQKVLAFDDYEDEKYLYREKVFEEENSVLRDIKRLSLSKKEIMSDINVAEIEEYMGLTFTRGQSQALNLLKTSGIKLLIGPPGSGKTALIKSLIFKYKKETNNQSVRLAATTGRAAQVMSEACGEKAETLHKMLDIRPFGDNISSRNENHPIDSEFIIVDEVSMLGLKLFSLLLRAVKSGSILLLVGDKNQLQSVEYGSVLKDLQDSGVIETYELTEVMRQSGVICINAEKINRGDYRLEENDNFQIYRSTKENEIISRLLETFDVDNDLILTTIKKTELGTRVFNQRIQEQRSKENASNYIEYGSNRFYVNDQIIMTETSYDRGYYNGEIGEIKEIDDQKIMTVKFSDRYLALEKEDFSKIELAYAVTVHKAQGSEFSKVHIVLPVSSRNMLTRRILYTAVTRAKKNVIIYSMDDALEYAVSNQAEWGRCSILKQKLIQLFSKISASCLSQNK